PRNWLAHGFGSAEAERAVTGDRTGNEAGARRGGGRLGRGTGRHASHEELALRHFSDRPLDVLCYGPCSHGRRAAGVFGSRFSRGTGRSDGGVALRMMQGRKQNEEQTKR